MWTCVICGTYNDDNFCTECGNQKDYASYNHCSNSNCECCKEKLSLDQRHCGKCGSLTISFKN